MATKRTVSSNVKTSNLRRDLCLMGIKRAYMVIAKKGRLTALRKRQFHAVRTNGDLLLELGKLELPANLSKQDTLFVLSSKISFADIEEKKVLRLLLAKLEGGKIFEKIDKLSRQLIRKRQRRTAKHISAHHK